jgi:hypothetical protein
MLAGGLSLRLPWRCLIAPDHGIAKDKRRVYFATDACARLPARPGLMNQTEARSRNDPSAYQRRPFNRMSRLCIERPKSTAPVMAAMAHDPVTRPTRPAVPIALQM